MYVFVCSLICNLCALSQRCRTLAQHSRGARSRLSPPRIRPPVRPPHPTALSSPSPPSSCSSGSSPPRNAPSSSSSSGWSSISLSYSSKLEISSCVFSLFIHKSNNVIIGHYLNKFYVWIFLIYYTSSVNILKCSFFQM